MSSYNQRPSSRVLQDSSMSNLVLFGDKALVDKRKETPVSYYHVTSPVHQQDERTEFFTPLPAYNERFQDLSSPEPSKGGLFKPSSRPTSAVSKGWPLSAAPLRSILSSPSPRQVSRPPSGPGGEQHVRFDVQDGDPFGGCNDPEYEPVADVLSRLGEYTRNFAQDMPVTYTDCECRSRRSSDASSFSKSPRRQEAEDSDDENSSPAEEGDDDDEEDTGIDVEVLLKMFQQYEDKGHSTSRQKATMTLLENYTSEQKLEQEKILKIIHYLKNSVPQVQDACMVLLCTCVKNKNNLETVLDNNVLDFLCGFLAEPDTCTLTRPALLLMEQLFTNPACKSIWLEMITAQLLPRLLSMLKGVRAPLDVKYAICCVFRALARHAEFVGHVTNNILPAVIAMKNTSARFKEVFVEILTALLSQTSSIPLDLIDGSAIPVTVSIVSEGPCGAQYSALNLLTCLATHTYGMIATMINTESLVPMLLCCIKESHCRKVCLKATEVVQLLCQTRRLGLCKDLMLQLYGYLVPSSDPDSLTSLSQLTEGARPGTAGGTKQQKHWGERHLWLGLEKLVEMTKDTIFKEGQVETDDLGLVTDIHMKAGINTSPLQLQTLTHAFTILHTACLWPLDNHRLGFGANKIDLTHFTDSHKQRTFLSKVNRGLTQLIWDKVGTVVPHILRQYGEKLTAVCKRMATTKQATSQHISMSVILEREEADLVTCLLELTLCSALCTCETFPQIIKDKNGAKLPANSSQRLKSSSSPSISSSKCSNVDHLKSRSDVGFMSDSSKNASKEIARSSKSAIDLDAEKSKLLQHKEACTDRRLLRKCLFETGVFESVFPFLQCSELDVQIIVLQILRCLVQPLEERVAPKLHASTGQRLRPQSAKTVKTAQDERKRLNLALCRMSPDLAGLIKDALEPQADKTAETTAEGNTQTSNKAEVINLPDNPAELSTIHERLDQFTVKSKESTVKEEPKIRKHPMIDRCRPIAQQCREAVVSGLQENLVMGIFTKASTVRKHYVTLLHDMVHFGETEIHMQLSTFGCIPRLIDFLRVNDDNELLEIIGLIIVRMLVSSDGRLKQLFNRHGGPQLLLSMAQYTSGLLQKEVATTLKTVSKVGSTPKRRPVSAPASRIYAGRQKTPDIWDHIQDRWNQEDQVKTVLRQWIEEDIHQRPHTSKH